jgi:hypothetical protein
MLFFLSKYINGEPNIYNKCIAYDSKTKKSLIEEYIRDTLGETYVYHIVSSCKYGNYNWVVDGEIEEGYYYINEKFDTKKKGDLVELGLRNKEEYIFEITLEGMKRIRENSYDKEKVFKIGFILNKEIIKYKNRFI